MLYGTVTEFCTPQEVRLPVVSTVYPLSGSEVAHFAVPDHVRGPSVSARAQSHP